MTKFWSTGMNRRRIVALASVVTLGLAGMAAPLAALAQDATPAAMPVPEANGEITVFAEGLTNPRGMTWTEDGTMYLASAGEGGTDPAVGTPVVPPPNGPHFGGKTAAVMTVTDTGAEIFVDGLPSTITNLGSVLGAADVATLDGELYVLIEGGGPSNGNPDAPNGIYRITDGSAELVADLSTWVRENPVSAPPDDFEPDGSPYAMVAGDGALWIAEANMGQVLTVTPDGTIERIADLSAEHLVPTGIALAPDGGVYVGYLGQFPYIDGSVRVDQIAPDGTVTEFLTGLTAVTSLAVGPDGALYVLEMTTNNTQDTVMQPGSGRVLRHTGGDEFEPVVTGLTIPVSLAFGPDDALYISSPAVGANDGTGTLLQVTLADMVSQ